MKSLFGLDFLFLPITLIDKNSPGGLLLYLELPVTAAFLDVVFPHRYMHHLSHTRTRSILVGIFPRHKKCNSNCNLTRDII